MSAPHQTSAPKRPRLLLVVRSLNRGGAQRQLVALACGLRARGWDVSVARFYAGERWEEELRDAGVTLHDLNKRGRWDVPRFIFRLGRLLRDERPTIIHGYLPVPNLLTLLSRALLLDTRVVWGVRASGLDFSQYDWLTRVSFFSSCIMARFADLIIANSHAGKDYHVAHGYPSEKMLVIPNGIDSDRFRFDATGRPRLRSDWSIPPTTVLIGLVGRLDPMKDHSTFLQAGALLTRQGADCRFVCVGDGPAEYADRLGGESKRLGVDERVIWAGGREDMAAVYSALDIVCNSSTCGEGFPNVVAEAMACGRPCVVTDVGDSALIVGDAGTVVPPRDPAALARALAGLISMSSEQRAEMGRYARQRVVERFSLSHLLDETERALLVRPIHAQPAI